MSRRAFGSSAFDIVGDVHGCAEELRELLRLLGYRVRGHRVRVPVGRQLVFVGDLVDRGPDTAGVLELVMAAAEKGQAQSVMGNHDRRLARALTGARVVSRSVGKSVQQLAERSPGFRAEAAEFLATLPPRLTLDGGKLVVAHAGDLPDAPAQERDEFNVEGRQTGRRDALGLKERYDWVTPYRGDALVVYGHTPTLAPDWRGQTLNLDTGCVYGGRLSALRYPEMEIVSVSAERAYAVGTRWRALRAAAQKENAPKEKKKK